MHAVVHTDVLWLAQWQHLKEPGGGADNPHRLVCPSLCPFRVATCLPREGRWRRLHLLKEHLFLVSRSEKVMGQVETSQRGWIQPTGHELDHAELVKIAWTQLVWHMQLLTCIKYQFVHATVSSPSQLQLLCDHLMCFFLFENLCFEILLPNSKLLRCKMLFLAKGKMPSQ